MLCRLSRARDRRHCFGTHAALFGVNPWRLQSWMGHKRIEETMLYDALKRMSVVREGFVVRNADGSQKSDGEANWWIARICRKAGLPVRYWHTLRHNTEPFIILPAGS